MKDSRHTMIYLNYYFFNGRFEYGGGGIFKLLRWMKNLQQSMANHKILFADR
jgi:hypothetical protein